jgi:nuclear pore complex protein Nup133
MVYIHHNGGLSLLPEGSRRRLCSHAEKVKSATELWDYQNRLME